ncbi:hypothetical protein K474DRAFT_1711513 [Panus rudis PR-1116 ss-1]|nr:hypothetical protein K474DRAFT_1711513 [Panus rudis PR-1116 ss-1]
MITRSPILGTSRTTRQAASYSSRSRHLIASQATILLLVPYETVDDDVIVSIERKYIVAGVRGQVPILKGKLYGNVDVANSMWQLEPRASRLSARERTTSSTSTASASTQSSFAILTDPEISSSFAASLEGGLVSESDDLDFSSPALSSPISGSADDYHHTFPVAGSSTGRRRVRSNVSISHPISPRSAVHSLSAATSFSSLESLHTGSTRLLTIHLEKAESMIWPSLVTGPVPESLSPPTVSIYPWAGEADDSVEAKYNMDPTSLVLLGLELSDIRDDKTEAFEYFIRAWHQARLPSASVRLATNYFPLAQPLPSSESESAQSTTPSTSPCPTPTSSNPALSSLPEPDAHARGTLTPGTPSYNLYLLGGLPLLAHLYLETGLLYLEGTASNLLSSSHSYTGLSSLRSSTHAYPDLYNKYGGGTDGWKRDRENARRFFERARMLDGELEVPVLPPSPSPSPSPTPTSSPNSDPDSAKLKIQMPTIEINPTTEKPDLSGSQQQRQQQQRRRRRLGPGTDVFDELNMSVNVNASSTSLVEKKIGSTEEEDDNTWYLYLPGLVGAGTALLVMGFLSFSSWRKSQGS